nr:retrovirus-related Pol polyprotein from transposon TNT 1-94 [Tanacetum cinerariifolium]
MMTQKLGDGFEFKKKACFVCGSLNHLIKECNFYENKMVGIFVFKNKGKATGQREVRLVWNNAQRVNHQNFSNNLTHPHPKRNFVPTTIATKSGQVAVNTAKQSSPKATTSISTVRPVNTAVHYQEIDGGFVAFGGSPKGGKITRKGKIRTEKLDFEDVYFAKELKFNLFSVSQVCDKKNSFLFTETECLVLSPNFKLLDENQVFLKVPRQNNMYSFDLKNVVPSGEAVNTACYVQNRVLVTKPHNKTPYELLHGRTPSIGFMRPFGCPVTILNTLDSLGKFNGKVDEGFLIGYSVSSKAFRVFNSRTRIIQETLHVKFLENKPNVAGSGPTWLFDIDCLTKTMNYQPITAGNQSKPSAGFQDKFDAEKAGEESNQQYVLFPVWSSSFTNPQNTDGDAAFDGKEPEFDEKKLGSAVNVSPSSSAQSKKQDDKTKREAKGKS